MNNEEIQITKQKIGSEKKQNKTSIQDSIVQIMLKWMRREKFLNAMFEEFKCLTIYLDN